MNILRAVLCAALLLAPAAAIAQSKPCTTAAGEQIIPCTSTMAIDGAGKPLVAPARAISGSIGTIATDGKFVEVRGTFNFSFRPSADAVLTLLQERSFDQGATWFVADTVRFNSDGDAAAIFVGAYNSAALANGGLSVLAEEPEAGVLHRVRIADRTAGSVAYRISQ